jgi:hypothetical protein
MSKEPRAVVRNAANPQQVEDAEQLVSDREHREIKDFIAVSSTPEGSRLLWRFLEEGSIFTTVWQENHAGMAYKEGQRNMALRILHLWTTHNPDSYMAAMKAQKENG